MSSKDNIERTINQSSRTAEQQNTFLFGQMIKALSITQ
jgi:hypothetical protein